MVEQKSEWTIITPTVNSEAEFFEIVHDFGDPLEVVREAISNAFDANATWIRIGFDVEEIEGNKRLVVKLVDNGTGMTEEVLSRDFWGLGYSQFRERKDAIGEKGHGTKIYLRSESVTVRTQTNDGAFESTCARPLAELTAKRIHKPIIRMIEKFQEHNGTEIRIVGYNDNERSRFTQNIVKDYMLWFTKLGSIEGIFGSKRFSSFKAYLKCLDQDDYEEISFGHPFPEENSDIEKLFNEKGAGGADWYVKRYLWQGKRLAKHPEVKFDVVVSVEGDSVKRSYNPLVGERRRFETGRYRMSDRYGVWLCKDYIPVKRVNDWLTGFGAGSNAFIILHGFVNCQSLQLTANRGDIANKDPLILDELKTEIRGLLDIVDKELDAKGIYTLREWQEETHSLEQEKAEFARRTKALKNRRVAKLGETLLVEPRNESELFGLLMSVLAIKPGLFEFEPKDYNANKGIDMIARNKAGGIGEHDEHWYVELKRTLQPKRFNHAFQYLRWIVCWDFDKSVVSGCDFQGIEETDIRQLQDSKTETGKHIYFLDSKKKPGKVQVIRLKEYLTENLGLNFANQ